MIRSRGWFKNLQFGPGGVGARKWPTKTDFPFWNDEFQRVAQSLEFGPGAVGARKWPTKTVFIMLKDPEIKWITFNQPSCSQENQAQTLMTDVYLHNFIIPNEIIPPRVNAKKHSIIYNLIQLQTRTNGTQMRQSENTSLNKTQQHVTESDWCPHNQVQHNTKS